MNAPNDTAAAPLRAFGLLARPVIVSYSFEGELVKICTRNHGAATIPQSWQDWEIDMQAGQVRLAAQRSAEDLREAVAAVKMTGGWIPIKSTAAQSFIYTLSIFARGRKNVKLRELAISLLTPHK